MKYVLMLFLPVFFLFATVVQSQTDSRDLAKIVADRERAFAAAATARGNRAAFLEFAADNAVVFGRTILNAKEWWQNQPPGVDLYVWKPSWTIVGSSGDVALSSGPSYYFKKNGDKIPAAYYSFASIWRKQPDGSWKYVLDIGIEHKKHNLDAIEWVAPEIKTQKPANADVNAWRQVENVFNEALEKQTAVEAYKNFINNDNLRILRPGIFPLTGKEKALEYIGEQNLKKVRHKPLGGETVADFIYAYGEYEATTEQAKIQKGFYLRVWMHTPKGWRIVFDVQTIVPPND